MLTGVGVGRVALSPGSREMLVVPLRYQLLLGPGTTSGGFAYHRFAGTPVRATLTNVCTPGDATNTPSEPLTMKCLLSRMSPTHRPTARTGLYATVTASLKLSVVPVLAATMWLLQCSALLKPKIGALLASSAMIWAMM